SSAASRCPRMVIANDDKLLRTLLALAAGFAALAYVFAVAIEISHGNPIDSAILRSGKYLAGALTPICASLAGFLLRSGDRLTGWGYVAIAALCMFYYVLSCAGPIALEVPLALGMLLGPLLGFAFWP